MLKLLFRLFGGFFGRFIDTDKLSDSFPVSVKAVIREHNKVLLLLNERGQWDLPGGKLEKKGDIEITLVEEVKEGGAVEGTETLSESSKFPYEGVSIAIGFVIASSLSITPFIGVGICACSAVRIASPKIAQPILFFVAFLTKVFLNVPENKSITFFEKFCIFTESLSFAPCSKQYCI